ncbi:hypothetical protein F0344_00400 [Streptomyces finlayi]|uniref:Uncharacterized protein n=1 Tax=Streptomyces finlayi TaxID=67296 RepID=A0A7G7BD73_9ACTN|nr:hypothetical protein [Streptomyces finlayi]QNE73288.1 hypothetical protein F0344_00400 [Streptomyces finlayi]
MTAAEAAGTLPQAACAPARTGAQVWAGSRPKRFRQEDALPVDTTIPDDSRSA